MDSLFFVLLFSCCSTWVFPAEPEEVSSPPRQGAELLKTDILAVFAHPDDETGMAATLASYAQNQRAVVANVYCTRGEGGGNMVGLQAGAALGALREAELRDCLNLLGVRYCYFLDELDWAYTESVAATLEKWGKESTLEKLVRLVRALRPEIILTMNPAPTPGQHGHHQAAGVLATEAFAAAADPARFPLQITKEGLTAWQARKLYFGGGSTGVLATIQVAQAGPSSLTPAQLAARALSQHRSQAFGNFGNSPWLQRPQRFTLVKTFVPVGAAETNLLDGLPIAKTSALVQFVPPTVVPPFQLEFVPRPALAAYRQWAYVQGIQHVTTTFRVDRPVIAGEANELRLRCLNSDPQARRGQLSLQVPPRWRVTPATLSIQVPPQTTREAVFYVTPPDDARGDADVSSVFRSAGENWTADATAHLLPKTRVARLNSPPALDGTDRGWETIPPLAILETNLVQGKVNGPSDSSARFRLAHANRVLFVDVQVRDDWVVTNIAPNDIKGHWRSDSIEICLDPVGGAEHTMGCFKLGVFPFDTSGVVRAARDADARQGPIEETAPRTRLISRRTSDGYRVQASIPFEEIGLKRGAKRLGFNLIIYDGDKQGAALGENINKSRLAWAPRAGVMGRPEDWGRLDLE
jgi:LmbE family N-acetylglucosaminyl deacetylase